MESNSNLNEQRNSSSAKKHGKNDGGWKRSTKYSFNSYSILPLSSDHQQTARQPRAKGSAMDVEMDGEKWN